MRKNYINLRHQQYADYLPSELAMKHRICILPLIPHQSIDAILGYLRLSQITQLYMSLSFNHKHQEVKRSIFNYLSLSSRIYSKWEEKQFLDTLTLNADRFYPRNFIRKKQTHSRQASDRLKYSTIWRHPYIPGHNVSCSQSDQSRIVRCKQSIFNDVDRTFLKGHGKNSSKRLENRDYSIKNFQKASLQVPIKYKTESECKQTYPGFGALRTEPPLSINWDHKQKVVHTTCMNSDFDKKTQQSSDCLWETQAVHQQKMQRFLRTVLVAICEKYQKIGYIQGFNYIVKNMFLTGFSQEEACRYLAYFIEEKNLGSIVFDNMVGIKKLSYALKVYIFNYVPAIYQHFVQAEVEPEVFCLSWFVTLFSEDLSVEIVNKLWHLFALEGWKVFIKFPISFLCAYQVEILTKQPDQIFTFMRRIMESFNQQCKIRTRLSHCRWGSNQRRQEIVWKLMTSVEVNGNILSRLCQEMSNLQSDCEIELWRIEQSRRNYEGHQRFQNNKKSLSTIRQSRRQQRSATRFAQQPNRGGQMCCDRMYLQTNQNFPGQCRPTNLFSLCHNLDTCID